MARRLRRLKLNQKFTLVIFCVVLVPVVLLTAVLMNNMQSVLTEEKRKELEGGLAKTRSDVDKAVEMCNMTTQVFSNSPNLRQFLLRASRGTPFTDAELIEFYRSDVASFERMVNANPYLYQARVYYADESLPEFMPILYHQSRMERLAWADSWAPGGWQFDYVDDAFPEEVRVPTAHVMSLVSAIEDPEGGTIGVLEVAVRMEDLLPGLYKSGDATSCLVTGDGTGWYHGEDPDGFWAENGPGILALLQGSDMQTLSAQIAGEQVWISAARLPQLDGLYITVSTLGDTAGRLVLQRNLLLLGMTGILVLLAILVNLIVKAMLRRLYKVFGTISQVQQGDLSVAVPDLGEDEVGSLATQLNLMLDRIVALMHENVSRQLLAKNSQIRALQSQINAHFIYNVLESIKMMAEVEGRYEISDAITSLGKLLRYSMRQTGESATLAEEVESVRDYLALTNLRFDYRITLVEDIPPGLLPLKIPRLTLQPLVENAVVHGLEALAEDSPITLRAREADGALSIEVADRGRGMPPEEAEALNERLAGPVDGGSEGGIGLKNVQDRIRMACGEAWGITVESRPGHTRVTMRLPAGEGDAPPPELHRREREGP